MVLDLTGGGGGGLLECTYTGLHWGSGGFRTVAVLGGAERGPAAIRME